MTVQPIATLLQELRSQRTHSLVPSRLPSPAELIGRERELAVVMGHLAAPDHRLITLVGPGGVGKTTLAVHVAMAAASDADVPLADGVAVALLASVGAVVDVPLAISAALGVALQGARSSEEQLIDVLSERALLLVLDNVEHLLGPDDGPALIALLSRMLHEAPGLRLLVTSRERLRLRDEWVVELGGLAVPPSDVGQRVEQADALRLFVRHAERTAPKFRLDSAGRAAVARICRQVEGLPLAIELAASWVNTLDVAEIAAEVERALDFLVLPARDIPDRHRSMRAVLDHSWAMLDAAERATLMRLAVFRGGADRDAATAITGASLPTFQSLLHKSLLRREAVDGVTRYTLHELVRQYAAERLAAEPALHRATEAAHIAYFAALLNRSFDLQTGSSAPDVYATVVRNIDNIRGAWERAAEWQDAGALGLMRSLWIVLDGLGWLRDAVALLKRGADALRGVAGAEVVRGHLLGQAGYFLARVAEYDAAAAVLEEGVALLQTAGEDTTLAMPLIHLGSSYFHQARFDVSQATFERAYAVADASGDHFSRQWTMSWIATINELTGDVAAAERWALSFVSGWQGTGYARGEGIGYGGLGEVRRRQGRIDEATTALHQGLEISGRANDTLTIGLCLAELGAVGFARGEFAEARYLLTESAALMRDLGDPYMTARALAHLARVEVARGDLGAARKVASELARLALAGETLLLGDVLFAYALLLERSGDLAEAWAVLAHMEMLFVDAFVWQLAAPVRADLERRLDPQTRADAAERGRGMALAVWLDALARRQYVAAPVAAALPPAMASTAGGILVPETRETLSPREVEVLGLIVGGASNRQIAEALVISLDTTKHHVSNILQKLGVASRTQAAIRGRELGLASP